MKLFSGRKWTLVLAQAASCCVHEMSKRYGQFFMDNTQNCLTIGQIKALITFYILKSSMAMATCEPPPPLIAPDVNFLALKSCSPSKPPKLSNSGKYFGREFPARRSGRQWRAPRRRSERFNVNYKCTFSGTVNWQGFHNFFHYKPPLPP